MPCLAHGYFSLQEAVLENIQRILLKRERGIMFHVPGISRNVLLNHFFGKLNQAKPVKACNVHKHIRNYKKLR